MDKNPQNKLSETEGHKPFLLVEEGDGGSTIDFFADTRSARDRSAAQGAPQSEYQGLGSKQHQRSSPSARAKVIESQTTEKSGVASAPESNKEKTVNITSGEQLRAMAARLIRICNGSFQPSEITSQICRFIDDAKQYKYSISDPLLDLTFKGMYGEHHEAIARAIVLYQDLFLTYSGFNNYLFIIPSFYRLLIGSRSNWGTISSLELMKKDLMACMSIDVIIKLYKQHRTPFNILGILDNLQDQNQWWLHIPINIVGYNSCLQSEGLIELYYKSMELSYKLFSQSLTIGIHNPRQAQVIALNQLTPELIFEHFMDNDEFTGLYPVPEDILEDIKTDPFNNTLKFLIATSSTVKFDQLNLKYSGPIFQEVPHPQEEDGRRGSAAIEESNVTQQDSGCGDTLSDRPSEEVSAEIPPSEGDSVSPKQGNAEHETEEELNCDEYGRQLVRALEGTPGVEGEEGHALANLPPRRTEPIVNAGQEQEVRDSEASVGGAKSDSEEEDTLFGQSGRAKKGYKVQIGAGKHHKDLETVMWDTTEREYTELFHLKSAAEKKPTDFKDGTISKSEAKMRKKKALIEEEISAYAIAMAMDKEITPPKYLTERDKKAKARGIHDFGDHSVHDSGAIEVEATMAAEDGKPMFVDQVRGILAGTANLLVWSQSNRIMGWTLQSELSLPIVHNTPYTATVREGAMSFVVRSITPDPFTIRMSEPRYRVIKTPIPPDLCQGTQMDARKGANILRAMDAPFNRNLADSMANLLHDNYAYSSHLSFFTCGKIIQYMLSDFERAGIVPEFRAPQAGVISLFVTDAEAWNDQYNIATEAVVKGRISGRSIKFNNSHRRVMLAIANGPSGISTPASSLFVHVGSSITFGEDFRFMLWGQGVNIGEIPNTTNCTAMEVKDYLAQVAELFHLQEDLVNGTSRAAAILTGKVCELGTKEKRVNTFQASTLEMRESSIPRTIGVNFVAYILIQGMLEDEDEAMLEEGERLRACSTEQENKIRVVHAMLIALSFTSIFQQHNLTGMELGLYFNARRGASSQLIKSITESYILGKQYPAIVTAAVAYHNALLPFSISVNAFHMEKWCGEALRTMSGNENIGFAGWYGFTIPYLYQPAAMLRLGIEYDAAWGIVKPGVKINVYSEVVGMDNRDRQWQASLGDSRYITQASSLEPFKYIPYGLLVLNIISQNARHPLLRFVRFQKIRVNTTGRALPSYESDYFHDIVLDQYPILFLVKAGILLSYWWETEEIIAPVLRKRDIRWNLWDAFASPGEHQMVYAGLTHDGALNLPGINVGISAIFKGLKIQPGEDNRPDKGDDAGKYKKPDNKDDKPKNKPPDKKDGNKDAKKDDNKKPDNAKPAEKKTEVKDDKAKDLPAAIKEAVKATGADPDAKKDSEPKQKKEN